MPAKKKVVAEPVVDEPIVEEPEPEPEAVDVDAPLPGTPVDFGVYEAPVGVPNPDPGAVVAAAQAADADEGDA